jgi:predicted DNA-binding transcriptional regulator AlpA
MTTIHATEVSEKLLTIPQLSRETGIPENSLRFMRAQGRGPKSARIGRRVMYRRADVERWIDEQFEQQGA